MIVVRWMVLLLLLSAAISFALYAGTGQVRFKTAGLRILRWTLVAAFIFFGVLILERIA